MNRPTTLHVAQDEQREAAPPAFESASSIQAVNMGLQAILAALSASVFTLDVVLGSRIGFELLYLGVILAAALSRNGATIRNWTGLSLALALLAFAAVHRTQADWLEVVQLVLSVGAIGVTGTILVRLNELDGVKIALEASQSELQAFSDNVPQLLWRARPDGYCDFLNRRYAEMMGLDPEAAIREQSWGRLFHPDDAARVQRIWENGFRAGEDFQFYGRKRTADQSYCWYHISGVPHATLLRVRSQLGTAARPMYTTRSSHGMR